MMTIVNDLTFSSIDKIQLFDLEPIPRLCKDMIAHVVRLIRSSREGNEHVIPLD